MASPPSSDALELDRRLIAADIINRFEAHYISQNPRRSDGRIDSAARRFEVLNFVLSRAPLISEAL